MQPLNPGFPNGTSCHGRTARDARETGVRFAHREYRVGTPRTETS